MEYAAYIVIIFTGLQFLVSLANLIFSQGLEDNSRPSAFVSVLIPARNEENNISNILSDLKNQPFSNIEVIVFDDESTDRTADIVRKFSETDTRVSLIKSGGLPEGWLGKNHACHNLGLRARGEYLLFLDADVRISEDLIPLTLSHLVEHRLSLLTIFPKQIMITPGEKSTVPVMNYILLTLLPMILVRESEHAGLSAANGQFMLFEAKTYREVLPHQLVRNKKVEDIAIIRHLKKRRHKVACLGSSNNIRCRMYKSYGEAVNGFSKNMIMFFANSYILAIMFWLIICFGFITVIVSMPWWLIIVYFFVLIITRVMVSIASRQPVLMNIIYMIPQNITMGYIILKSLIFKINREYNWKGRNIS